MLKNRILILVVILALAALAVPVSAQEPNAELPVLATDLLYPRGIAYDSAGNLYIAEAGVGGDKDIEIFLAGQMQNGTQGV